MSNLVEIQLQIDKLQKQAQLIKTREFAKTVQDIREKMQAFGITVKDLQSSKVVKSRSSGATLMSGKKTTKPINKRQGMPIPAKYRGPAGETWTGRGLMPLWLRAELAQGRTKEEFLIV